jgi:hypothetical protein
MRSGRLLGCATGQLTTAEMYELARPPHLSYATLEDVPSPRIRALHAYWQSKCSDVAPPPRSAIEPADIRALLPYLMLVELTPDPFRITYRLVGTAIARWHAHDFTGRDHHAVASLADSGIEHSYRRVLETGRPVFGRTGLDTGDGSWIAFDYAIFPLSDNGGVVNKCLAIACTGTIEQPGWTSSPGGQPGIAQPPPSSTR